MEERGSGAIYKMHGTCFSSTCRHFQKTSCPHIDNPVFRFDLSPLPDPEDIERFYRNCNDRVCARCTSYDPVIPIRQERNRSLPDFRVSLFIPVSICLFAVLTGVILAAGHRISVLQRHAERLPHLRQTIEEQAGQIDLLARRILALTQEMGTLRDYNRLLGKITDVSLSEEKITGIGGGYAGNLKDRLDGEVLTEHIITRRLHAHVRQLRDDLSIELRASRELLLNLNRKQSIRSHTPSGWPIRGWITSRYGWRTSPFSGRREFHKGIDIASRKGTAIHAPADGMVTACFRNGGYGNFLVIHHGFGITSRYGHLLEAQVDVGQCVHKGDTIGLVGSSGRCTGPHLHYEILMNGVPIDPGKYMGADDFRACERKTP